MRSYEIGLFVSLRQNCIRREATALRGGEVGDVQKERVDRQLAKEISKSTNRVDFIHLTIFFFFEPIQCSSLDRTYNKHSLGSSRNTQGEELGKRRPPSGQV